MVHSCFPLLYKCLPGVLACLHKRLPGLLFFYNYLYYNNPDPGLSILPLPWSVSVKTKGAPLRVSTQRNICYLNWCVEPRTRAKDLTARSPCYEEINWITTSSPHTYPTGETGLRNKSFLLLKLQRKRKEDRYST